MNLDQKKVQHLYHRAGFGASYTEVMESIGKTPEQIIENISSKNYDEIEVSKSMNYSMIDTSKAKDSNERLEMLRYRSEVGRELNASWLRAMYSTKSPLKERMALFWHDHFACHSNRIFHMESYLSVLRKHALGNFRDLLHSISKNSAMIVYLNNNQNKKTAPNENFAREVMELFTLGQDQGYTEEDIKEAARGFTGWTTTSNGQTVFKKNRYDDGVKTILGKTGNFTEEDVLEILLEDPQTARYICQKMVRYFLHPEGHPLLEKRMSKVFFESNYDIQAAVNYMFSSRKFYESSNIGVKIKSPVDLIVSSQKILRSEVSDTGNLIMLQKKMNQLLFSPPNVAGWPGHETWIDSNTLPFRMLFGQALLYNASLEMDVVEDADEEAIFQIPLRLKKIEATTHLELLESELSGLKDDSLINFLFQYEGEKQSFKLHHLSLIEKLGFLSQKLNFQLC